MMGLKVATEADAVFARSRDLAREMEVWLSGGDALSLTHAALEEQLGERGRELLRQFQQDHLDLRTVREQRLPAGAVVDAEGWAHRVVEPDHPRKVTSVFGQVTFSRIAYRAPQTSNLHPADAVLNLPVEMHSHGLRRLVAIESTRGSFDDAADAVHRTTGVRLGKRQVLQLAQRAAADVDAFYVHRRLTLAEEEKPAQVAGQDAKPVLALSCDGKGIVMRPEALRDATARKATSAKLSTRLSRGEKRNRKRMAEVGCVFDITPQPRTPADIIAEITADETGPTPGTQGPRTANKWYHASVVDDAADVIACLFDEADRRDPEHARTWIALVDGNAHQINRIRAEARARHVTVTILIDFIHVIEYLWKAAWCFHNEGDPAAEAWVADHALTILAGKAGIAAAAIRRKATYHQLEPAKRAAADTAADYLLSKRPYLDYPTALASGWSIATGVIEGACRHLVKDRFDLTGARWGLDGAEAILKLRSVVTNNDLDNYWTYHLDQEHQRVHASRYYGETVPTAA